jgi:hypothetical protein
VARDGSGELDGEREPVEPLAHERGEFEVAA